MDRLNPSARSDEYGSRINRDHSPVLLFSIPPLTIILGSLLPQFVLIGSVPIIPPFGLMLLLAWRIVRPGMFPVWIGFPLGLIDDLFSGQPLGSAILLWSLAMIAIEIVDARFPWRSYVQDWMMVTAILGVYLFSSAIASGAALTIYGFIGLAPQFVLSALLFPIVARMVARFDRLRLTRIKVVG